MTNLEHLPTIFISYSHKDEMWKDKVVAALKPALSGLTHVAVWSDKEIELGDDWESEIFQAMGSSRAAILLISNDFLNSDFILQNELPFLLPKAERREIRLFIIYLSTVAQHALKIPLMRPESNAPFDLNRWQAANSRTKPLNALDDVGWQKCLANFADSLHKWAREVAPLSSSPPHGDDPTTSKISVKDPGELAWELVSNSIQQAVFVTVHGVARLTGTKVAITPG